MARRTKQAKLVPVVMDDPRVKFMDLPVSKRMLTLQVDYTDPGVKFNFDAKEIRGAVIKLVVRYNEGTNVSDDVAGLLTMLGQTAAHVRPPEYEVVRRSRRRVEDGFGKDLTMLQAAEAFMDTRPPKVSPNDVVARLGQLFEKVELGGKDDLARINPFTIRRVVVEGFMPYKDRQEVVLGEHVYGVVGLNKAGKSSLLDAIEFALTGKTGRKPRSNDRFIHNEAESASVQVDLDFRGEMFTIARHIDKKGSMSVDVTGYKGGKVSEAEEVIRKKVGVGTQDLLWTCIMRQRELGGLLGQTSAPMQDALFRWLGIDVWAKAEKLADAQVKDVNQSLEVLNREVRSLEQRLEGEPPGDDEIENIRMELNLAENTDAALVSAESKLESVEELVDLFDLASLLPERIDVLEAAEYQIKQDEEELVEKSALLSNLEADVLEARLMSKDGFSGACPVDGAPCPRTGEINKDVKKFKMAERAALEAYRGVKQTVDTLQAKVRQTKLARDSAKDAQDESKRAAGQFSTGTKRLDLVAEYKKAEKELSSAQNKGPSNVAEVRARYESALTARAVYNKDTGRINEVCAQVDDVKAELALARYVWLLCSRQGVPSMIVEGAIGVVEQEANDTLERLGTPHRLEFSFETEIKKPATTCRSCGAEFPKTAKVKKCEQCGVERGPEVKHELTPLIVEDGSGHDYAMDSGGGQDLVALAVRVALSRFMGATLLIVDEACANLDDVNVAAFTRMIAKLGDVGFKQVLVSSHRREVKDTSERLLVVEREGGVARVSVEG